MVLSDFSERIPLTLRPLLSVVAYVQIQICILWIACGMGSAPCGRASLNLAPWAALVVQGKARGTVLQHAQDLIATPSARSLTLRAALQVLRRGRSSAAHALHLDWAKRLNMAMDAAKGMLHLHLCDPPIIHRDLKSPNLLVDKHWRLKVCLSAWGFGYTGSSEWYEDGRRAGTV